MRSFALFVALLASAASAEKQVHFLGESIALTSTDADATTSTAGVDLLGDHYGSPASGCADDETMLRISGVPGSVCAPKCTGASCFAIYCSDSLFELDWITQLGYSDIYMLIHIFFSTLPFWQLKLAPRMSLLVSRRSHNVLSVILPRATNTASSFASPMKRQRICFAEE